MAGLSVTLLSVPPRTYLKPLSGSVLVPIVPLTVVRWLPAPEASRHCEPLHVSPRYQPTQPGTPSRTAALDAMDVDGADARAGAYRRASATHSMLTWPLMTRLHTLRVVSPWVALTTRRYR